MHRSLVSASCALLLWACGAPTCPPPKLTLPTEVTTIPFTQSLPTVSAKLNDITFDVLLDTGFDRSAVSSADARIDLQSVQVEFAGVKAGPTRFDVLIGPTGDNVIGNEVLHQLPIVFDRGAQKIEIHPVFQKPVGGDIPLLFDPGTSCRDDASEAGAEGPFGMLVLAEVEGTPVNLLLDTGSELTFVRTSVFETLTNRPVLSDLRVATGFAGLVFANAVRAKQLSVDVEKSPNALVVSSPSVDKGLDEIAAKLSNACDCKRTVDGLLGWTFLREYRVDLRVGTDSKTRRSMRLFRKDTQDHYKRDFVGVGIYFSQTPAGLKVDAFLNPSSAKDAGLLAGDVITKINNLPAAGAIAQLGQGTQVALTIDRGGATQQITVPIRDPLPDLP